MRRVSWEIASSLSAVACYKHKKMMFPKLFCACCVLPVKKNSSKAIPSQLLTWMLLVLRLRAGSFSSVQFSNSSVLFAT